MELKNSFSTFLADIRLTSNQISDCVTGHTTLTKRLWADADLSPIIVSIFLQGSYRRSTAVRPKGAKRADVDIIVVTNLDEAEYADPNDAIELFIPFVDKYYKDKDGKPKYEVQGRSIGIELSYVDLDLVITSAPSELEQEALQESGIKSLQTLEEAQGTDQWDFIKSLVESRQPSTHGSWPLIEKAAIQPQWRSEPLRIPDRDAEEWKDTHPLEQMRWTWAKNKACNKHYVNVVKALKWWRRLQDEPQYPKGYPVEHMIGQHCPDGIDTIAKGVVLTLEGIASSYSTDLLLQRTPCLPDHGVSCHDVWARVSFADFAAFHAQVCEAAKVARAAYDATDARESAVLWQSLFGTKFPVPEVNSGTQLLSASSAATSASARTGPRPLKDNPYF